MLVACGFEGGTEALVSIVTSLVCAASDTLSRLS
jgi:hypothetical protein